MPRQTRKPSSRPFIPRILLAFDFDRTLAEDSTNAVLEVYGIARQDWERGYSAPLGDGWDAIIQRGQALIDLGNDRGRPLTRAVLDEAAARVKPFPGVLDMPGHLRGLARGIHPDIELEFLVLSSGFADIIDATEIGRAFDRTLASAFHFDADGRARAVKRIVGHSEKTLYLEAIGKDVGIGGANAPEAAGHHVDEHDMHVLFDQMVYVGDGDSDLHAFGFMRRMGGFAIAVDKDQVLDTADAQQPDQRVDNLAPPDYSEGGELLVSLEHAVRACASRIALRALGRGE
jgi:hypothetical protein